jgi:flagellum-specific peptidoglycan hydrolase FlgJ
MAALGFFTDDNSADSYEASQRRRKLADALLAQSQDGAPIQSWTQGGAKLLQALSGTLMNNRLDARERETTGAFNKTLASILGGGSPSALAPSQAMTTADASPKPVAPGGSQPDFVSSMLPHAMKVAQETGLDPRLVIAQSALETGWGKSAPGNNFFGIKSHGQAGGNTLPTTEVVNGQPVRTTDSFRAYGDMGESAKGYAEFLKANPRYREVLGAQGLDAQIEAMARSGYATDPQYGAKLRQIAAGIQLPQGQPTQMAQAGGGAVMEDAPATYSNFRLQNPDGSWRRATPAEQREIMQINRMNERDAGRNRMEHERLYQGGGAPAVSTPPLPPTRPPGIGMTTGGMPTSPVPSNAPPMSYAPGQQAISAAAPQQPPARQQLAQAVAPSTSPPIPAPQPQGNVAAAMAAILADPRFSPQQKQQAMQMYQLQQREGPKWEKLNDGTLYNPRTAETRGVGGGYRMLTDPADRARYGIAPDDKRPYQLDPAGKLTGVGGSTTNVNVGGGSDKQIFDALSESATAARAAATGLNAIREARKAIDGGGIFGAGADIRLGLAKVASALGADPSTVQNTETFRAAIAPQVAAMLKATVGTTQISNTDRDFAEKAAGGSIALDEGSIRRLLSIMERGGQAVLDGHQERLDAVYDDPEKFRRERSLFRVRVPDPPPPDPAPAAGPRQPPRAGQVIDGYRFKGGDPSRRENWEQVR